ncbi:MAG: acyltransferase [Betaproteobacteria bacterium]|nr:acyltransferase [Betaproteobacteria bacterium]
MASPHTATHWAQAGETTFVAGIRFLGAVHRWLGRGPFLACLYPVVLWHWVRHGEARRASLQYLRREHAFHGRPGPAPGWRQGLKHFLSFADTILDKTLAASGRYPFERVRVVGREPLEALLAQGQGAVIMTAHVGCLELCQALAQRQPSLRLNVLVHTAHAERFNRVLSRLQPGNAVHLMQVTEVGPGTAVLLSERAARGEFIAVAGDRVPVAAGQGSTASASFLGHSAPFPVGAYVLAMLLKCPLYMLGCVRQGGGHLVIFERLAERVDLPRERRAQALASHAGLFAARLERLVERAPMDWFNFFHFWEQPTGSTRRGGPGAQNARNQDAP